MTTPTQAEKLEMVKEELGWYFGGVAPMYWNPYENVGHLGRLMDEASWETSFQDMLKGTNAMMPFSKDGREKLVDLCGGALGLWEAYSPG